MATQAITLKALLQHKFGSGHRTLTDRVISKEITDFQQVNDSNFAAEDVIEDILVEKVFAFFSNDTVRLTITRVASPSTTQRMDINGVYVFTPDPESTYTITITNPGDEPVAFSFYYS